jgi:DHA1 family multidrug resistance protein-like MFS transporter
MIGLGITQPVLPFYVERLALGEGASRRAVAMHIGLITGVFALGQLLFAPVWGRWSDRTGRRPLLLIGIAGYAVAQILFGLATSLWLLYVARILGGILSSAALPAAAAYVADMTTDRERGRGMASLGTATSLGFVVGPGLGGILARRDLHFSGRYWCFMLDSLLDPVPRGRGPGGSDASRSHALVTGVVDHTCTESDQARDRLAESRAEPRPVPRYGADCPIRTRDL